MRIDLHTHSTASDGLLSPARLVQAAREHGVGVLALTDHDTTDGVAEACAAGRMVRVEVIPGVEINTDVDEYEVHILGYFIDSACEEFQALLCRMRAGRAQRAERMVEKLLALGIPVAWTRVQAIAGGGAIGRPHIARALVEARRVDTMQDAFDRYLGRSGPAYVPRPRLSPEDAVAAIAGAGGVPVLAHPGWRASGPVIERVPRLIEHGLRGIEVYYPDHSPADVAVFLEVARRYGLVATGGTDYHGDGRGSGISLGRVPVPPEAVAALRACREAVSQQATPHAGGG